MKLFKVRWTEEWEAVVEAEDEAEAREGVQYTSADGGGKWMFSDHSYEIHEMQEDEV